MKKFTGFCQEANGEGTIWISSFEAKNLHSAINKAQRLCAAAWGFNKMNVHVLGIAAGDVAILHWEDLNDN